MTTVLVTGVGAIVGQGILQALRSQRTQKNLTIIGVDRSGTSHARYLCTHFVQKPEVAEDSSDYTGFWSETIRDFQVDIILPGIENDVVFLSRPNCKTLGFPSLVNSPDTLRIGVDKYALALFATEHDILTIPTALASDDELVRTLIRGDDSGIIKPRKSSGSRGVHRFRSADQLSKFIEKTPPTILNDFIIQPHLGLDSEEYTASIFGFGNGQFQGPIVFRRLLANDGYTQYAQTVDPPNDIVESITRISALCAPVGPTNFQYRVSNGVYHLMEINPRFSSTTSLKAAFGFDEVGMSLDFFLKGTMEFTLELRHGEAWRYISDFVRFS